MDMLLILGAFLTSYTIRQYTDLIPGVQIAITDIPPLHEFIMFALVASFTAVIVFASQGLYRLTNYPPLGKDLLKLAGAVFLWFMIVIGYFFVTRQYFFSRLVLIYAVLFSLVGCGFLRVFLHGLRTWLQRKGIGKNNIIILGKGNFALHVSNEFSSNPAYHVAGTLGDVEVDGLKYLGGYDELENIIESKRVDTIVQTGVLEQSLIAGLLSIAKRNHVEYCYVPDVLEMQTTNVDMSVVGSLSVFTLKNTPLDGWGRVLKRSADIIGSSVGIILLSPLWLCTAVAVWIQMGSFREIIFKQKRYGYRGKLFQFYKFQSMYVGAYKEHEKLMNQQAGERKGLLKINHDPRVTPVGRVIRKTSLDELPQLWNVFIGSMSLVGPRPHIPEEVNKVTRDYYRLLNVKPGITGLAQISGRSDIDFDDEMKIDTAYVENWSLWMDMVIILKTIWKVLRREGVQK